MNTYSVYSAREKIGTAEVVQQGLYYRIRCLCNLSGNVPMRIIVKGDNTVDLGLCVPIGKGFGLESSIPIKKIGKGELQFQVIPKHERQQHIEAISPEKPFSDITRLKDAYLVKSDVMTAIGFRITNQSQDLRDNDQNP